MKIAELRVLLADNEPRSRRRMSALLEQCPGVEFTGETGSGEGAVRMIHELKPDVVFLEAKLPDMDGFEALARIPRCDRPLVVIVAAHDQHAIKAFEFEAIDYIVKPIKDARFLTAVDRAKERWRCRKAEALNKRLVELLDTIRAEASTPGGEAAAKMIALGNRDRVVVKYSGEAIVLNAAEIDWIEADGDYMKFHVGPRSLLQRETMASLEARLDPGRFRRIHRSTIVNLDQVAKFTPAFNGEHLVQLKDGTRLKLSKGYQGGLQEWLRAGQ